MFMLVVLLQLSGFEHRKHAKKSEICTHSVSYAETIDPILYFRARFAPFSKACLTKILKKS